jgi:hypothetical protein
MLKKIHKLRILIMVFVGSSAFASQVKIGSVSVESATGSAGILEVDCARKTLIKRINAATLTLKSCCVEQQCYFELVDLLNEVVANAVEEINQATSNPTSLDRSNFAKSKMFHLATVLAQSSSIKTLVEITTLYRILQEVYGWDVDSGRRLVKAYNSAYFAASMRDSLEGPLCRIAKAAGAILGLIKLLEVIGNSGKTFGYESGKKKDLTLCPDSKVAEALNEAVARAERLAEALKSVYQENDQLKTEIAGGSKADLKESDKLSGL